MKKILRVWAPPAPWLVLIGECGVRAQWWGTIVGAGSVVLLVRF